MFRLAHLSDPYRGPLPTIRIRQLASKRMFGFANWHRRTTFGYANSVVAALTADLAAKGFDHLAVTGDLTNLGLTGELAAARAWLSTLGGPGDVTVIPGNHDVYVPDAFSGVLSAWAPYIA